MFVAKEELSLDVIAQYNVRWAVHAVQPELEPWPCSPGPLPRSACLHDSPVVPHPDVGVAHAERDDCSPHADAALA